MANTMRPVYFIFHGTPRSDNLHLKRYAKVLVYRVELRSLSSAGFFRFPSGSLRFPSLHE
jgi:hypothetical protein